MIPRVLTMKAIALALDRPAAVDSVTKIVDISELSYDEMGDLKRMVDSEVIRRVMAKVEQNAMAKAERKER